MNFKLEHKFSGLVLIFFLLFQKLAMAQLSPSPAPPSVNNLPPSNTSTTPQNTPPPFDDWGYYKKYGKNSKSWNDSVKNGFEAYDRQDCEKAISYFKEALEKGCNDPILIFKLAACSEFTGSTYSALQYYQQVESPLRILPAPHPYQKDFDEVYGRALYMNKKYDEAFQYLSRAGERGTPSFALYYILGELFLNKGQAQMALSYFNKALALPQTGASPVQLARIYGTIGKSYLELKDLDKAIQYLDLGLKYAPTDGELQQARYKANEIKRQNEVFQMMDNLSKTGGALPPLK